MIVPNRKKTLAFVLAVLLFSVNCSWECTARAEMVLESGESIHADSPEQEEPSADLVTLEYESEENPSDGFILEAEDESTNDTGFMISDVFSDSSDSNVAESVIYNDVVDDIPETRKDSDYNSLEQNSALLENTGQADPEGLSSDIMMEMETGEQDEEDTIRFTSKEAVVEENESSSGYLEDRVVTETGEQDYICAADNVDILPPGELLDAYAEGQMYSVIPRPGMLKAPKNNWLKLNGINRAVYWKLREAITDVAAGKRSSTEFYIAVEDLGLNQTTWTDEELGMAILSNNGTIRQEAKEAVRQLVGMDYRLILQALLSDCPYELYWYDKTDSTYYIGYSYSATTHSISIGGTMVFELPVVDEYALGEYRVDSSYGQSIQSALNNAQSIINTYAACADYEKLDAYRIEICNLTAYNYAVLYEPTPYGNPWQLIWVFDGNPETKVVCEGYAKAFQYLCDLSDLSDSITAYTVSGYLDGNGHMWNMVTMEDGYNYLVDVTNCDMGSSGYPNYLFLSGYQSGNVKDGYYCAVRSGTLNYTYDTETCSLFSAGELTLADHRYREREEPTGDDCSNGHQYVFDRWMWAENKSGAEAVFNCERNEAHVLRLWAQSEKTVIPPLGGNRYTVRLAAADSPDLREYSETVIDLVTGWLQTEDGYWYYLDDNHDITTGWVQVNGKWYYMNSSGAMQTGWIQANGKWYYMNGSGAMQTGWVQANGKWYYMSSSGAMQTGWVQVNGKWYCMSSSGAMQTGWVQVNGKWYYMESSGVMLANTSKEINGKVYRFNSSGVCTNP